MGTKCARRCSGRRLTLLSLTAPSRGSAHRGLQGGLAHGKRLAAQTVPVELKKIVERGVMRHEKGSGVNSGRFVWEIEGVNFRVKKSTPKNRADFSSVAQWADIEVCALWPISRFPEFGPERNRPAQTGRRFDQTIEHGLLGSAGGAELESAVQLGSPFPRPRAHSNLIRECRRQAVTSCCRMQRARFCPVRAL